MFISINEILVHHRFHVLSSSCAIAEPIVLPPVTVYRLM